MSSHYVCNVEELDEGGRRIVNVNGTPVGVLKIKGEYFAIENICAHQGGPVCEGKVQPELIGEFQEPGDRVVEKHGERYVIACPWHGWEYDLETGSHLGVTDIEIETFDVQINDGAIYIET